MRAKIFQNVTTFAFQATTWGGYFLYIFRNEICLEKIVPVVGHIENSFGDGPRATKNDRIRQNEIKSMKASRSGD